MMEEVNVEVPLAVTGCDYRIAPTRLREVLVSDRSSRLRLHEAIRKVDASAGLAVLETCNRVEWIVSTDVPCWMADLLAAQMTAVWKKALPDIRDFPRPYIHVDTDAVRHILRVVAGMESLAVGEAQVAGQFQRALNRAIRENTSALFINGLGTTAGRVAKAARAIGFRSNRYRGIHALTAALIRKELPGDGGDLPVAVAGMGEIGRKTAAILEEDGRHVRRFNRTVSPVGSGAVSPLSELGEFAASAAVVVLATGAPSGGIFRIEDLALDQREAPLLVVDIGIPRQLARSAAEHPLADVRTVDDLESLQSGTLNPVPVNRMDAVIRDETDRFVSFCRARNVVELLDMIHRKRKDYISTEIPRILAGKLKNTDESVRRQVEDLMKQLIREYANDIFNSIHTALDDYRRA